MSNSTLIPVENLPTFLPYAGPWLQKTIESRMWGNWTIEVIIRELERGNLQLWAAEEDGHYLFVVTEVVPENGGKSVQVILGGGSLDSDYAVVKHLALIEEWARNIGAHSVGVWGRLGWKRLLQPYGYQHETTLFRRSLTERMH